jgi:hypothetical protein
MSQGFGERQGAAAIEFQDGVHGCKVAKSENAEKLKVIEQARLTIPIHIEVPLPNGYDICPDVLRHYCEIGRVCSQVETDNAFAGLVEGATAGTVREKLAAYKTAKRKRKCRACAGLK